MRIKSGVVRGISCLARSPELSKQARQRLNWLDYCREHEGNARLICRHFDISPQTFYRRRLWVTNVLDEYRNFPLI